jgi:putative flavoprotein involved in K+ transport
VATLSKWLSFSSRFLLSADVGESVEVAVIGGGQAGLATGYYLRRAGLAPGRDFVILDAEDRPGGAWQHMWDGLRLFSPATYSNLPGWMMPPWDDATLGFPRATMSSPT